MNQPTSQPEFPTPMLAAYVDGELSPAQQASVEEWLTKHPELGAELADQAALSANHPPLQREIEPPMPTAEAWEGCLEKIIDAVVPVPETVEPHSRFRPLVWGAALVSGIAAAIFFVAVFRPSGPALPTAPDREAVVLDYPQPELAPVESYAVAKDDDVNLIRLPAKAHDLVVVGKQPLDDAPIVLASATDVEVFSYGPDEAGSWPNVFSVVGPDAPMIVTTPGRR